MQTGGGTATAAAATAAAALAYQKQLGTANAQQSSLQHFQQQQQQQLGNQLHLQLQMQMQMQLQQHQLEIHIQQQQQQQQQKQHQSVNLADHQAISSGSSNMGMASFVARLMSLSSHELQCLHADQELMRHLTETQMLLESRLQQHMDTTTTPDNGNQSNIKRQQQQHQGASASMADYYNQAAVAAYYNQQLLAARLSVAGQTTNQAANNSHLHHQLALDLSTSSSPTSQHQQIYAAALASYQQQQQQQHINHGHQPTQLQVSTYNQPNQHLNLVASKYAASCSSAASSPITASDSHFPTSCSSSSSSSSSSTSSGSNLADLGHNHHNQEIGQNRSANKMAPVNPKKIKLSEYQQQQQQQIITQQHHFDTQHYQEQQNLNNSINYNNNIKSNGQSSPILDNHQSLGHPEPEMHSNQQQQPPQHHHHKLPAAPAQAASASAAAATTNQSSAKKYKGEFDEPTPDEVEARQRTLARPDNYHYHQAANGKFPETCACVLGSEFRDKPVSQVLAMIERWRQLDTEERIKSKWDVGDLPKDIPLADIKKFEELRRDASRGRADFGGASKRKPLGIRGTRQFLLILYCLWGHPGRDDVMQKEGYCPHCFAKIKKANEQSTLVRVVNHFNMKHRRGANPRLSPHRDILPTVAESQQQQQQLQSNHNHQPTSPISAADGQPAYVNGESPSPTPRPSSATCSTIPGSPTSISTLEATSSLSTATLSSNSNNDSPPPKASAESPPVSRKQTPEQSCSPSAKRRKTTTTTTATKQVSPVSSPPKGSPTSLSNSECQEATKTEETLTT